MLNDEMLAKIASLYNIPKINKVWFELNLSLDDEAELQNLLSTDESEMDVERITDVLSNYPPLKPYINKQNIKLDYIKESLNTCDSSSDLHIKDLLDESLIKHIKNKQLREVLSESLQMKEGADQFIKEKVVDMISPLNSAYMMMLENNGVSFEQRSMKMLYEDMEPIQPIGAKQPIGTIQQEKDKKTEQEAMNALSTMTPEEIKQRADMVDGVNTGENQETEDKQDFATEEEIENMSRDELAAEIEKMRSLIDA